MSGQECAREQRKAPQQLDAALRDTVALLELVRREADVLVRLGGCVRELEAIRCARTMLASRTDVEVSEAGTCVAGAPSEPADRGWVR